MANADPIVIERLTDSALDLTRAWLDNAVASPAIPFALMLLLRRYRETGRDDLREAIGAGLAQGTVEASRATERDERSAWLAVLVEALGLADDDRIGSTAAGLVEALSGEWPGRGSVASIMRAVDVVLTAGRSADDMPELNRVASAVDEMERVVGHVYAPGSGVAHEIGAARRERGTLEDHACAASALLTALHITGRIPYGMLADELMQSARRAWWHGEHGWEPAPFAATCEAVRVLCRLATLHEDAEYRQAAIVADVDYAEDAARALSALELPPDAPASSAIYGIALMELRALR